MKHAFSILLCLIISSFLNTLQAEDTKYELVYSLYFDASLEVDNNKVKTGSLNDISNYLRENKPHASLMVITFSKGTQFDLSDPTLKELAKKVAKNFAEQFKRIIVRTVTGGGYQRAIYDSQISANNTE